MRILHWTENCYPLIGGVERLLDELVEHQCAVGHSVAIVADRRFESLRPAEARHGAQIRRFSFFHALESSDVRSVKAAAEEVSRFRSEFRPDVVHVHFSGVTAWFSMLTRNAHPAPSLATLHMPLHDPAVPPAITSRLLESADWVTTVSAHQRAEIAALSPALAAKASVLPNGLSAPALVPKPLSWSPPGLLCFGRVVADKGFDVALRALPALLRKWPGLRLVLAGDGPARSSLERLAAELNLGGSVEFRGWVEPTRIHALINEAAIVLMPSRWAEPFGLVAVDTALMARPIVASRVGGIPEVVDDGNTGILVPPDDPEALSEAVGRLLDSPALGAEMGARARRRALTEFSLERCAGEYLRLYATLSPA